MKTLLVIEPGVDGAFRHVEALAHFLIEQGVTVHLAYSSRRGSKALVELIAFIEQSGGETLDLDVGNAPAPSDLRALAQLRRLALRCRPDVIHAHCSKAGALARALPLLGVSASYFYTPNAYYGMDGRKSLVVSIFNLVEGVLGHIGFTFNISPDEAAFATKTLRVPKERSILSHNPIDPRRFTAATAEQKQEARRRLGLPLEAILLGSAGRLSHQKNPQLLTRAFAQACRKNAEVYLVHLGQGALEQEIKALREELSVADRVLVPPYLDEPLLFYHAIDAFVMASNYEAGWPIVTLEAMSCELPIITTTAPGMSEIGNSGLSHCWTAPPGEVDALAQAISAWLAAPRLEEPSNHRDYVLSHFTPGICFGIVLEAYRKHSSACSR